MKRHLAFICWVAIACRLGCSPALADTHWSGSLQLFGEGNVYADFSDSALWFTIDDAGRIRGTGKAYISPRSRAFVESDGCIFMHTVTPDTFDIAVEGRREKGEIWIKISTRATATIQFSRIGGPAAECKVSGQSSTPGMNPFAGLAMALGTKFHAPYRLVAAER